MLASRHVSLEFELTSSDSATLTRSEMLLPRTNMAVFAPVSTSCGSRSLSARLLRAFLGAGGATIGVADMAAGGEGRGVEAKDCFAAHSAKYSGKATGSCLMKSSAAWKLLYTYYGTPRPHSSLPGCVHSQQEDSEGTC